MILQRLAEHYDRLFAMGGENMPPPLGSSLQKISFCIVLNPDGTLNQFQSMQQLAGKSLVPTPLVVPGQAKPSGQGVNPCFLWDNAAYLLGYTQDPAKTERAALSFAAFRTRHLGYEAMIDIPAFHTVCTFLRRWNQEQILLHQEMLQHITTGFGVFRIAGETNYVHELIELPDAQVTGGLDASDVDVEEGLCLVSGGRERIARLHEPKIKGVVDAQSAGALLVSFNASAYESYGKSQSYNAPVSAWRVFKYANALNHLLARRDRRIGLGGSTVVFWADHPDPLEQAIAVVFEDPFFADDAGPSVEEDRERVMQAGLLLTQLRDGTGATTLRSDGLPTRFFLLGLSPNASRLSVRLWIEADATELRHRLGQHLNDVALNDTGEEQDKLRFLTLRRIVSATGRAVRKQGKLTFDTKACSPQLAGDLTRSVLTGAAYPQSLLATMIRRIHADREVAYARVAAIKACLVRNSRSRGKPLEVSVMLDPAETNPGYVCGRLFALLEKVQLDSVRESSGGELNSTIKDRYFSSASTTPALVFPRLFRLSQHHLAKLSMGSRIFSDRRLGDTIALLGRDFPRQLTLEDQGRFVLGYYHQVKDIYTAKSNKETPIEGAAA